MLDVASRFVLQLAFPVEAVDQVSLGLDQLQADFLLQCAEAAVVLIASIPLLERREQLAVVSPQGFDESEG
jgi:hypothetical protein